MGTVFSKGTLYVVGAMSVGACYVYLVFQHARRETMKGRKYRGRAAGRFPILGLPNSGGTLCFINAVIQALSSSQALLCWLAQFDRHNSFLEVDISENPNALKYPTIAALYRAIIVVNRYIRTHSFLEFPNKVAEACMRCLADHGMIPKMFGDTEQDSYELLQFLLQALDHEVQRSRKMVLFGGIEKLLDDNNSIQHFPGGAVVRAMSSIQREVHSKVRTRTVEEIMADVEQYCRTTGVPPKVPRPDCVPPPKLAMPFGGLMGTQLECTACKTKKPIALESFATITLPLGPPWMTKKAWKLERLITKFMKPTLVTDVDCDTCTEKWKRAMKTNCMKKTCIARLPVIICIHISRTVWSSYGARKRLEHVEFPEMLDLSFVDNLASFQLARKSRDDESRGNQTDSGDGVAVEEVTEPPDVVTVTQGTSCGNADPLFDLFAVISHSGSANSGHFVAYRRHSYGSKLLPSDSWFLTSDEVVYPVTVSEVLNAKAYLLFYERRHYDGSNFS